MKQALLIIDMQNAYFEDGTLERHRPALTRECNRLARHAAEAGSEVLVVVTEHQRDRSTWTLSMLEDEQGFLFTGSRQAQLVEGLEVDGFGRVVKTRDSAFFGTDLAGRLRTLGVEGLVLAGVSTHNCIAHTAADAFASNFRVAFAEDAIASTNEDYASSMLTILSDEYRQPVLSGEPLLQALKSSS
ncbi:cysteine hydrolase family protein [uncultured Arthrobacter sp.]|uniref:cysteine hydrolase family protein n=1 Tax=uncultured Arthrobacter sp. TaxID=114050 RepID=UPI0025F5A8BF|nr:isochorismatase family cysteine hydrolase [uncultured Arthrobacter sp.]